MFLLWNLAVTLPLAGVFCSWKALLFRCFLSVSYFFLAHFVDLSEEIKYKINNPVYLDRFYLFFDLHAYAFT